MTILYDHFIFSLQQYGGISRYHSELIKHLAIQKEVDFQLPILFSNNHYIKTNESKKVLGNLAKPFLPSLRFPGKGIINLMINHYYANHHLPKLSYDIYHPTYYHQQLFTKTANKPMVLTVHDMIHELFPEYISWFDKTKKNKRRLLQRATKIIAVSKSTKNDLVSLLKISPKKISVIYSASSLSLENIQPPQIKLPPKYLLYVGNRGGYKNFSLLVLGMKSLKNIHPDLYCVCAGGGKFTPDERRLFNQHSVAPRIIQLEASDPELAYLYHHAQAFVYPSLYEGFGLPILEAFSCQCPVITSNTSSLSEVGGKAALYFDPNSEVEMITKIRQLLSNPNLKQELIKKGKQQNQQFSWEKTAQQTIRLYQQVLRQKK